MDFFEALRQASGGKTDEDARTTDLEFSNPTQFAFAMLTEDDGERLIRLLREGEWKVVARMGLCTISEDGKTIRVPRWNNFISHLRIVSKVFDE